MPRGNSDQHAHARSLIRDFAIHHSWDPIIFGIFSHFGSCVLARLAPRL